MRAGDRVWVRSVVEAYDGLATWWMRPRSDELWLLSPTARLDELDRLLDALEAEHPGAFLTGSERAP